jgi:hypothetical protein
MGRLRKHLQALILTASEIGFDIYLHRKDVLNSYEDVLLHIEIMGLPVNSFIFIWSSSKVSTVGHPTYVLLKYIFKHFSIE